MASSPKTPEAPTLQAPGRQEPPAAALEAVTMCDSANSTDQPLPAAPAKTMHPLKEWAEMIKIEHTVFALPFALTGLLLASPELPSISTFCWTIMAFAGARAAAMTLNRLIDAGIDAKNPRTSSRAIPAGKIRSGNALVFAVSSFAVMILAATNLPPLCLQLSPIAVAWLTFYSYTKRFTWMCHLVLGIALGGAALGGWVAAGGVLTTPAPWWLALAVATWVAGFDIIYALQDVDFDRSQKLHSIPSTFGIHNALAFSAALHLVTAACLVITGVMLSMGPFYWLGTVMVMCMLKYEHKLVTPSDLSKVNAAFFTTNGIVSICAFVATLLDRIYHHI